MVNMPRTLINYAKEKAELLVAIGDTGRLIIPIIEPDVKNHGKFDIVHNFDLELLPKTLSEDNLNYIKRGMIGSVNKPRSVTVIIKSNITDILAIAETIQFDYICSTITATDAEVKAIKDFIINLRTLKNIDVKAVLPNMPADHEGIMNFTTDNIKVKSGIFTTAQFCSRIAGLICGVPLTESVTYKVLPEVIDVPKYTRVELDAKVNAGELIIYHDGVKVKVGRGINSLQTIDGEKTEDYKYIKIVDCMDIARRDIRAIIDDGFIGKYPNTYANRLLLIEAIEEYLTILENNGMISKGWYIRLDLEAIKSYLNSIKKNTYNMKEKDLKEANTGTKVFLTSKVKFVNAIEDVDLTINN